MTKYEIPAYELLASEELPDIQSGGYLFKHKKSGARICVLSNTDENKVFSIAFRTTPSNSTGVAHILEHSTLCGSRKFPVQGSICGAGEGFFKYLFECHDLPGQDRVSGGQLQ